MVARAATAPFVARMDADDISTATGLPRRSNCCAPIRRSDRRERLRMIDSSGKKLRDPEVWRLSRRSAFVPFPHGTIMYRRSVFDEVGGYREQCEYWEDQDLVGAWRTCRRSP